MKKYFLLLLLAASSNHIVAMDDEDWELDELMNMDNVSASPVWPIDGIVAGIVVGMMPAPEFDERAREAVLDECRALVCVRPPKFYELQQQGLGMPEIVARQASETVEQMRYAANVSRQKSPARQQLITAK
jgi:hypothetical protein